MLQRICFRGGWLAVLSVSSLLSFGCSGGGGGGGGGGTPVTPTVGFGAPLLSPTGGVDGRGLVVADADLDGLADVFVVNQTLASVSSMRGQAGGGFANGVPFPAPSLVGAAAVADVSGDRIVDLVSASDATASATIAIGRGNGSFDAAVALAVPWPVGRLAVTDWNGDGLADLVATGASLPEIALLPGLGGGAFGVAVQAPTAFVVADLAIADFDGDQRPDVVCIGAGSARIDVLRNDGVGGFLPLVSTATTSRGGALACCDLNRDRLPDVVALDADLRSVTVFVGIGSASFTAGVTIGVSADVVDSVAVGDVDGDGATDVVVAAGNELVAAFGDGLGGLGAAEVVRRENGPVRSIAVADLGGIGVLDLVYVLGGNQLAVLQNPRTTVVGLAGFGGGTPDCVGRIGMWATGSPTVGSVDFGYLATNAPVDALGMLLQGGPPDLPGSDPFGVGLRLHLTLGVLVSRVVFSDPLGSAFVLDPVPSDPGLAGLPIHAQTIWLANPATTCSTSPANLVSSRGLTVTIQP